ncbi:MAG TPA: hypothetical protein VG226_02400 [Acidimicrobiales bacterium]|nr:hypothetical protein [Acidimicrobiales bacterium]
MAEDTSIRPLAAHLRINRRVIQIALGVLWIIAAGLKFQPKMFGTSFVSMMIDPMAAGQPGVLASSISHIGNFLSHEVAMWVTLFGLVELIIGVGLLFKRTVKPALVLSFGWALGVAWFGEGFGMVFTGHSSPLTGGPGAVFLYAVIGALVWPSPQRDRSETRSGMASSAVGMGPFGATGARVVWAALWVFEAILWLFPANRTPGSIHDQLVDTAGGEPGWYAHFLNSLGHAFVGAGAPIAVILAAASLIIGIGPLVSRRASIFIGLGMGLALLYWVTGEGVGALMTGMGSDPSNGPLVVLLGLAVLPTVPEPADAPVPAARLFSRHPAWATLGVLGLAVVPAAVAVVPTTPVATAAPTSSGPSPTTSSSSGSMPGMSMSGTSGSSTKGMSSSTNMSGMAGLGVTDPNWKYTGPPLTSGEQALLTSVGNATDAGHAMQTPNCTTTPTAAQTLGAVQYVQATTTAVAKYKELSAALAAGYVPITSTAYPIVHYLNVADMRSTDMLDPNHVDSLVYATTPNGPVLVAAMYLMPGQGPGPMPYGCLVQWHAHTNLCTSTTTHLIQGFTPCAPGTVHTGPTPMMTHVWQVPVAGGPLAIDPSDLQVVEAAIMAQQEGLAPTTTPGGTPTYDGSSSARTVGVS